MKLTNPFIGYVQRSYLQIKQDVLTKFQARVPEITDHTDSNPWVKGISIWASIIEMLGYYLDVRAREAYLPTAIQFESVVKIAKMFDYRVKGLLSSSVDVTFYLEVAAGEDITIPAGTIIKTGDNIPFQTNAQVILSAGDTEVTVGAIQQTKVTGALLGVSDGAINQKYTLVDSVVDKNIIINVDGVSFNPVDTFAYSNKNENVFVAGQNEEKIIEVLFGDDINGSIPASGKNIVADYYTALGSGGNVGAGAITQIASSISVPSGVTLKVTNELSASGGEDAENITILKRRIPLSIRTLNRAVTRQDYIDIANLAPGVAKSGLIFDCGKTVDLYIVPSGGGIASSQLLSDTADYFDTRKMVTTKVNVYPAGEVNIELYVDVYVLANYIRATVLSDVKDNLLSYLSANTQEIGGEIQIGNLYEIIEGTTGVDYSKINLVIAKPFPRPVNNSKNLDINIVTQPESSEVVKWDVKIINETEYELYKNGNYVNRFVIGNQVVRDEVVFTINDDPNYEPGDIWQFVSYPYNSAIDLDEPSVPVTKNQYLNVNGFGGL